MFIHTYVEHIFLNLLFGSGDSTPSLGEKGSREVQMQAIWSSESPSSTFKSKQKFEKMSLLILSGYYQIWLGIKQMPL